MLQKSIFLNFTVLIKGSLSIAIYNQEQSNNTDIKRLINLDSTLILTSLKLNKNIYTLAQFDTLITLNYVKNIKILFKTLNYLIKKPYYRIKN